MTTENMDYSKTVFLPKTAFSMKADLPKKEPGILEFWNKIGLYGKMLEKRLKAKPYILHDGPPYANGHIHIGHALNKLLKDITVKSRCLTGHYTPYVPGWDCHGLPIEQALLKELKIGKRHIDDVPGFRKKAREFAGKFIDIQREEFRRLGIVGDWANPYITMANSYEGTVIKAFRELLEKGYVHRDKKTIYWCVSCETALADAEVEYKDKTSPSIFVKFPLQDPPEPLFGAEAAGRGVAIVIWTTTPWTLPSNMAAAVSKDETYRLLNAGGDYLVVADKLADSFLAETGLNASKGARIPGCKLVGLKYTHCLAPHLPESGRFPRPVISTDFVDMSTGAGIVHIAPGHGEEDFHAGKKWELEIFCPVNEDGRFTRDAGIFEGLKVFEANEKVLETLKSDGLLLSSKVITHSYPHCWRCKQPVIFRATEQWFLKVDLKDLRGNLLREADKVEWIPKAGHERMTAMLRQRPDWCLSRQRYWGTPIMVLYCESCGRPQTGSGLLKSFEERVFREGSDFWFSESVENLLPGGYKCACGGSSFRKEKDIMDVWLDSGVSWYAVLKDGNQSPVAGGLEDSRTRNDSPATSHESQVTNHYSLTTGSPYPADIYLEGSDQHRGWFQTSLIPSVALNGHPPYKTVLTHGFVLDDHGRAMHKSMGNVVAPQEVITKYGAEVLRLWVALSDYSEDIRISDKLLSGPVDTYRKIRNTLRYLLGNLNDFRPENRLEDSRLLEIDRYMLMRLAEVTAKVRGHYDAFEYRQAIRAVADLCILDLSAFYLDALKDRLYTYSAGSTERRSAQTALYDILTAVLKMISPVLSFTAEEGWQTLRAEIAPGLEESVFLTDYPEFPAARLDGELGKKWARMMGLRETVTKAIEERRREGVVGSSLEARITFRTSAADLEKFLSGTLPLWPQVLIVSSCAVESDPGAGEFDVKVEHADGAKCPRCWQWKKDIGSHPEHAGVCGRCAEAL
ncbi:MAG TPA: isoleucine--tRNA ligase [Elusimicrobia bacterium]|nr:isoleucine--tRNA ligase [Elusimicrobiota bacterium]